MSHLLKKSERNTSCSSLNTFFFCAADFMSILNSNLLASCLTISAHFLGLLGSAFSTLLKLRYLDCLVENVLTGGEFGAAFAPGVELEAPQETVDVIFFFNAAIFFLCLSENKYCMCLQASFLIFSLNFRFCAASFFFKVPLFFNL